MSFWQESCAVVGAAIGIANDVCQLVLDQVNPYFHYFREDCACHRSKTVSGHFFFPDAHTS